VSLLSIRNLQVEFATDRGWVRVLHGVNLDVSAGEVVGIVGESGSGKSVTSLATMGLLPPRESRVTDGQILYDGTDLLKCSRRDLEDLRGDKIAMIFQEPMTSLNPALTVGFQIGEVVRRHRGVGRGPAREVAIEMLDQVGIPDARGNVGKYPHEFSGGMRQRVMIAMALACEPNLLIADEPTTALDVTIQAQILDLLRATCAERGLAMIFVTHDLGVVAELCDRVAVMYAGEIVEDGDGRDLFERPRHPYTHGLLSASSLDHSDSERLWTIPGAPPSPWDLPPGCRFAPRCAFVEFECTSSRIALEQIGEVAVRCRRATELVLDVEHSGSEATNPASAVAEISDQTGGPP
jgi:peptide/nickel transport system ATP-binding protein